MCLIALAWKTGGYRLVVAANRDERHDRPTAPLKWWPDEPRILAGRDLEGGGTWMGVTAEGRFAAITNFRDQLAVPAGAPSRGQIVRNFLESDLAPDPWLHDLKERATQFAGFNLFVGTPEELGFLSNRSERVRLLEPGFYGLSNGPIDESWPKVRRAIEGLQSAIGSERIEADLFDLLRSEVRADDPHLPETGVGLEAERVLSPIFIRGEQYGTRSSTVLQIDPDGSIRVVERSWRSSAEMAGEVRFWAR